MSIQVDESDRMHPNAVIHLLQNKSALANYIERLSISPAEGQNSRIRGVVRKVLELISLIVVVGARSGVVMTCLTGAGLLLGLPEDNPVSLALGIASGASVVVTFGAMSAFTMLKVIGEITRATSKEELALILNDAPAWQKTALTITSIAGGFIAQVPLAYAIYRSALVYPLPSAIFQFLDSGRTAYSINQTLTTTLNRTTKKLSKTEKTLDKARGLLTKALQGFRRALADKKVDQNLLLNQLNTVRTNIKDENREEERKLRSLLNHKTGITHGNYISTILSDDVPQIAAPPPINKPIGVGLDIFALILAGVVLAKFWQLGGEAADMFTEGQSDAVVNSVHYLSAAIVTLANLYLWISLVNKTVHLSANVIRRAVPRPITEKLHGRAHKVFTGTGVVASALTFVPQFYFTRIAFSGWPYYPIGTLSSLATALGGAGSTFALRDIVLAKFTSNENSLQVLQLDANLERILAILPKVQYKELAQFLLDLDNSLKQKLESPEDSDLQHYISEYADE